MISDPVHPSVPLNLHICFTGDQPGPRTSALQSPLCSHCVQTASMQSSSAEPKECCLVSAGEGGFCVRLSTKSHVCKHTTLQCNCNACSIPAFASVLPIPPCITKSQLERCNAVVVTGHLHLAHASLGVR